MGHVPFHYRTLDELKAEAAVLSAFLPLSEDMGPLFEPLPLGDLSAPNRIAIQPMEGTDGLPDGTPGPLTVRRYHRFAMGGPGLIWFEAVATKPEVRASAHQLQLTEQNVGNYRRLLDEIREISMKACGSCPVIVMQATNSGRYSKPTGVPEPRIAYHCPPLEPEPLDDACVISDDEHKSFEDAYANAAKLAQLAGFDGLDVKACHRYLACELLSAYTRPGLYGGSYENRTRFLKNCYAAAAGAITANRFFLTSRLNVYDGFPYPYGFGVTEKSGLTPDLTEPIRLIHELREQYHIPLINITMGNPYKNPHVNRPYDHGAYIPDEHPLTGISRMMQGIRDITNACPDLPVLGSAFTYPRQFAGNLAAGMVQSKSCAMAGFGRMAFAYPSFIQDLRANGTLNPKQICVTCGGCAQLLRQGTPAGCVVRDREVYRL
ncbi:MAG: flavin oxidoreductase/NADH oxidase [Clostridia bacterium]|nr:flavin oxidoreductase/NADH oxidase [Clostridia bacterium]